MSKIETYFASGDTGNDKNGRVINGDTILNESSQDQFAAEEDFASLLEEGLVDGPQIRPTSRRGKKESYQVLHGSPIVHRDTDNENSRIAKERGSRGRSFAEDGLPKSKKWRRKAKLPRRNVYE